MNNRFDLERMSRAAARTAYLGNGTLVANVLGGIKMFLPTTDRGIVPHLALDGFWEPWVTIAMKRLVKPGMHIMNVGANLGYYALFFASLVGPNGSIVAVEPNLELCRFIEESKLINGFYHLTVCNEAASDEPSDEQADFIVPIGHAMNGRFDDGEEHLNVQRLRVNVSTVDYLASEYCPGENLDIIFIDAEGAEERIWLGMQKARQNSNIVIVMEYSPRRYNDAAQFAKQFADDGFQIGFIKDDSTIAITTPDEIASGPEVMAVLRRIEQK
jgi:FkbM family methyltransferase